MNMSFSHTTAQVRAGTKGVTRRMGWLHATPGQVRWAIEKGQGIPKGGKVKRIRQIRFEDVRRERLDRMTSDRAYGLEEIRLEGGLWDSPEAFVAFFCQANRCEPHHIITRIAFSYVSEATSAEPTERIWCMNCGKSVSSPVPVGTIVRAWVACPECIEAHPGSEIGADPARVIETIARLQAERDRARQQAVKWQRHAQALEPAVRENLAACERAGMSFGRRLSGAGYRLEKEAREAAEHRLAELLDQLKTPGIVWTWILRGDIPMPAAVDALQARVQALEMIQGVTGIDLGTRENIVTVCNAALAIAGASHLLTYGHDGSIGTAKIQPSPEERIPSVNGGEC